ncbi:MAG: MBL fold metallo-hydrolase [Clostridiales bacterium]|nr:MBL fold metallo-hydrolase [Clostridiales bacterium]
MKVTKISGGPLPTNCYLLKDEETGACAVIDPGFESRELTDAILAEGVKNVRLILLTHGHFDHIMGVNAVKDLTGAKICIHSDDLLFLRDDALNLSSMIPVPVKPFSADTVLNDGDVIPLGSLKIRVMHTPGHTIGSCCYLVGDAAFTGDTLMKCTCGRTDFPTGNYPQMLESLQRLKHLEGDYHIYPGHEGESTLEYERKNNPYMGNNANDFID